MEVASLIDEPFIPPISNKIFNQTPDYILPNHEEAFESDSGDETLNAETLNAETSSNTKPSGITRRKRVPGNFPCDVCGKTFAKTARLRLHQMTHTGERPFKCTWEGCGKDFTRLVHMQRHMLNHTTEKTFKCTREGCDKVFSTKLQLKSHVATHVKPKPYACTWEGCTESFNKQNKLRRHYCIHTGEKPYQCTVEGCTAGFDHPSGLKKHVNHIHSAVPTNACTHEGCTEAFRTFMELQRHVKVAHPTTHPCDICHRAFKTKGMLSEHKKTHDLVRELFKCPDCDKEFTKRGNLNVHIRTVHLNDRRFVCTVEGCDAKFTYHRCLTRHIRTIHEKNKPPKPTKKKVQQDHDDLIEESEELVYHSETDDNEFDSEIEMDMIEKSGHERPEIEDCEIPAAKRRKLDVERMLIGTIGLRKNENGAKLGFNYSDDDDDDDQHDDHDDDESFEPIDEQE